MQWIQLGVGCLITQLKRERERIGGGGGGGGWPSTLRLGIIISTLISNCLQLQLHIIPLLVGFFVTLFHCKLHVISRSAFIVTLMHSHALLIAKLHKRVSECQLEGAFSFPLWVF